MLSEVGGTHWAKKYVDLYKISPRPIKDPPASENKLKTLKFEGF